MTLNTLDCTDFSELTFPLLPYSVLSNREHVQFYIQQVGHETFDILDVGARVLAAAEKQGLENLMYFESI